MHRLLRLIIAIAFVVHTGVVSAQTPQQQADSLLGRAWLMWTENPEAAKFALNALEVLAESYPNSVAWQLLQARALTAQAFGLDHEALLHVDSAIAAAKSSDNQVNMLKAKLLKAELCYAMNLDDYAEQSIESIEQCCVGNRQMAQYAMEAVLLRANQQPTAKAIGLKRSALKRFGSTNNDSLELMCTLELAKSLLESDDNKQALALYQQSLSQANAIGSRQAAMEANRGIALAYKGLANYDSASSFYQYAYQQAVELKNIAAQADVQNKLGALNLVFAKVDEALANFERSHTLYAAELMRRSAAAVQVNIARAYARKRDFAEATAHIDEALAEQEQLGDAKAEAESLNEKGNIYLQQGHADEALRYYLRALIIRTNIGDKQQVARSSVNIGIAYRTQNMLSYAAKYLEQAIALMEATDAKPAERVYALQNLAIVYNQQRNFPLAVATYRQALSLADYMGDELQTARLLCNLAQSQRDNGQLGEATASLTRALKFAQKQQSQTDIARIFNEQGNVERLLGHSQQALVFFGKAAEAYSAIDNAFGYALCRRKIGEVLISVGRYAEAEQHIAASIEMAQQQNSSQLLQYGYKSMYELFNTTKQYEQALAYHVRYANIRDSLELIERNSKEERFSAHASMELNQKDTEIRAMEAELENAKIRSEYDRERMERQNQERKKYIIIAIFSALLIVMLVIALTQKRRHARKLEEYIVEMNLINNRLNQSEQNLRDTLRTKDKLFSVVAHDLRSPIAGLVSLTKLMEEQAPSLPKDELIECSRLIGQSAENLQGLIENLLNWTRSQTGRLSLNPMSIELQPLVADIVQTAQLAAMAKNLVIFAQVPATLSVWADADTLKAAIRNLLSNAIKFTPAGGSIDITATENANLVALSIADSGVGMTAEQQHLLFDVDMRSTPGTNNEKGTGLGLLVCKEFVERNSGRISVSSQPGLGTTFTIELIKA